MSIIPAYNHTPIVPHNNEFFNAKTKKITPVDDAEDVQVASLLDAMTLATEAGIVRRAGWVKQFFSDESVFRAFLDELDQYEYRLNDRWHAALMELTGRREELDFVTNEEIAAGLLKNAITTKQVS